MSRPAESNGLQVSWAAVLVIVYICSLPGFVMNFVPLLVSAMVASFDLSEQQSGFIASADMAGYTVGAVAAFFIIEKANWRQLTRYSLFLMMLANVISSQVDGFSALLVLRFLSGVGGGMMTAVMLSVIAQMCNPDAVYGLWFAVMSLITIVGMALFPEMLEKAGLGAAFFTLAAMLVVCLPFLNALPQGASNTRSKAIAPAGNKPAVLLILASVFVLTTGIGSSWAFLGQIGSAASRILGAGLAAAMLFLMLDKPSYLLYTLCCFAFYGLWSFVLPYLLGALAELEQSGRALSLGSTAQGAGFMAGPFFASLLLYRGG